MKAFGYYKEKLGNKQIPVFCELEININKGTATIKNLKPSILSATLNFGDILELVFTHNDKSKNILLEVLTEKGPSTYEAKIIKLTENKRRFPRLDVRDLNIRAIIASYYFGFLRDISLRGFAIDIKEIPDKLYLKKTYPVKILYKGEEYKFSSPLIGMVYNDENNVYILRFRILESIRNIKLIDELYKKLFEDKLRYYIS